MPSKKTPETSRRARALARLEELGAPPSGALASGEPLELDPDVLRAARTMIGGLPTRDLDARIRRLALSLTRLKEATREPAQPAERSHG